jgi:hypothetical protein
MTRPILAVILSIMLVGIWGSFAAAKEPYSISKAYSLEKAERGWAVPDHSKPSSVRVAADLLVGRPLGLIATTAAAGVFVVSLPFNLPSRSVQNAAYGLKQVGGWTFKRKLGEYDPRFVEPGVFSR